MSPAFTDGDEIARFWKVRPFGMRSNSSAVTLWAIVVLLVSMSGDSVVTVIASVTPPTFIEGLRSRLLPRRTLTSATSEVANPDSSKRTV